MNQPAVRIHRIPRRREGRTHWYAGWPRPPGLVVLHFAATGTAAYTHEVLVQRGLSVHCTIEREGTVSRHVDAANRCLHVGPGEWAGWGSLNSRALGIEIVNFGRCDGEFAGDPSPHRLFDWDKERPDDPELNPDPSGRQWWRDETYGSTTTRVLTRQTAVVGGPESTHARDHRSTHADAWWCIYPDAQVDSIVWQVATWGARFGILPEDVVGHEHVSPGRKDDPGPAFPWRRFHTGLRAAYEEQAPELIQVSYRHRDRIRALQSHLARLSLPVGDVDGFWGPLTRAATKQALERFRPIYGWPDDLEAKAGSVTELCRALCEIPGEADR